jgi:hypothetical protein
MDEQIAGFLGKSGIRFASGHLPANNHKTDTTDHRQWAEWNRLDKGHSKKKSDEAKASRSQVRQRSVESDPISRRV